MTSEKVLHTSSWVESPSIQRMKFNHSKCSSTSTTIFWSQYFFSISLSILALADEHPTRTLMKRWCCWLKVLDKTPEKAWRAAVARHLFVLLNACINLRPWEGTRRKTSEAEISILMLLCKNCQLLLYSDKLGSPNDSFSVLFGAKTVARKPWEDC